MSKVFRPYDIQGNNTIIDWGESQMYGTQAISEIKDPDGATAAKEITSIPSPFARIDLVKTAFKEVVEMVRRTNNFERLSASQLKALMVNGGEKHPTIYHKMVSETLDVAEIFFNYDRFKNMFEIIVWDRDNDLDVDSVLGNALNRYLTADATGEDPYNFGRMNRIYLLNYIGPDRPSGMNIVGATSPSTMFFSSADDMSYVSKHVAFGSDRPFDEDYQPLFLRDFEFQQYLFAFRMANADFARLFPEINEYLDLTYRCLSNEQMDRIDNLTPDTINSYDSIAIGANGNDTVDILQRPLHKRKPNIDWVRNCDFVIKSDIYQGDKLPLVLPVEQGNMYASYTYTINKWENSYKAPYYDNTPWKNRSLPIVNENYPYLTISDFLADTVVRVPYEINSASFFDGNYHCANSDEKNSFLLPLTNAFFQFFTVQDLQKEVANGKKMFEFVENTGGVKAILRIPVRNGYIEYNRVYFEGMAANLDQNDGALIETKMGMGVMPLVRFPDNVSKHYRIAFFDKGKTDAFLSCYDAGNAVKANRIVRSKKDLAGRGCSHESYVLEDNFDRICVKVGDVEGFVIPKFKTATGNTVFTFAVDFGTTNTHIEYCTDANKNPVGFNIKASDKQLHKLHKLYAADPDIRLAFEQDFIPDTVNDNDPYSFPMRTVFAERVDINYEQSPVTLGDGNIPFLYEKSFTPQWNNIKTELKWGGVHERLLEMNLETLFMLMRNKVIANNGNLPATKVIWFYPASMTEAKVNQFRRIWREAYEKYFGLTTTNVISISESKAPYLHYITTQGAAQEVVTIDVGGGTTDIFVVENQEDKMLLSFRFASNAIFGDGYNSNPSKNGFVRKYKDKFKQVILENKFEELQYAIAQIEESQKSSDIIAFLFSLVGDKVKNNKELDFLRKLANDDKMRYVFIFFYGSILYFIANVMKVKGLLKPKTIAFSGNGARTMKIVSEEPATFAKFAKLIFDGVYGDTKGSIEVMMEKNPKIATCKGGIEDPRPQPYDAINGIKSIFVGDSFVSGKDEKLMYKDITDEVKENVVKSVKGFFDFIFKLHKDNNDFLINSLAADPLIYQKVYEYCTGAEGEQKLETSLAMGLHHKCETDKVSGDTVLEETLFFYPLVGLLHDLAYKIFEMEQK